MLRAETTLCLKKTSHLWLAITLTHMNGFWYFLAEMLPIKQAIKRRFTMPPQVTCASALPGKIWKRKNHIFTQLDCVSHNALARCLPERKSCHLWCVWQRLTFVEIVRYPINTVHWLLFRVWRRTTPIIYTATDTVTDLVNTEHVGNRHLDAMLPS